MRRVALAIVVVLGCQGTSKEPAKTAPSEPATEPETPPVPVQGDALEANKLEKRTIGDTAHRYHVRLEPGQVAVGAIEQRGVDVVVTIFDPWGKQLAQIDSPNGERGPEPFVIEATRAGEYGIEVTPFVPPSSDGTARANTPPAGREYTAHLDAILSADAHAERQAALEIDSPRILALWKAVRAKQPNAVKDFWDSMKGKAPIVEPYPGDEKSALVTFVFRSDQPYAGMFGGPSFREKPMIRLLDTDVWYLSARMPSDSRTGYSFIASDHPAPHHVPWQKGDLLGGGSNRWTKQVTDENNPGTNVDGSRVELLPAVEPWIAEHPESPHGTLETLAFESQHMHEQRRIGVYLPPGYDKTKSYPLVIAYDGEVYGMGPSILLPLPRIVDNLLAAKKIPPVVVALVANQGTRDRDLTMNAAFADFVATELVPRMRTKYRAGLTAASTIVTGSSFGGLCSIYTGLHHSDVIGSVLAQSAALWFRPGDLDRELRDSEDSTRLFATAVASPKLPLRFYLDVGLFETDVRNDILATNRRMNDVLRAKGYPVRYVEYSGGHDYLWWQSTIPDALIELLH